MSISMTDLGELIFKDRYAQKAPQGTPISIGNEVVALLNGKREIAEVLEVNEQTLNLKTRAGEKLPNHPINLVDLLMETTPEHLWDRVAKGIASVEVGSNVQKYERRFRWLLEDFRFVPAGRILTAAGTDQQLTAYNCYVIPSPHDSRGGIFKTCEDMVEIMARGGGVGINVSSLRPRNAPVRGVNGRSNGAVSWAGLYSFSTGQVMQAGSRRGALMVMLNDWHPDIMEFINAKRDGSQLTNCNISVAISDAFMEAVKNDGDWTLLFPDTAHPAYDSEWNGDIIAWQKAYGYEALVKYATVSARSIWDAIIASAHASAEPGVFFLDRYNKMSNSNYYPEGQIICCNPCAEQGLPAWGVCNLGALNLPKFFDDSHGDVNWDMLSQAVTLAVRFLDNVIDWTPYFFSQNEKQQKDERRVGLGIMGLAELLIKLELRYGSPEAVEFTERLMKFIMEEAYWTSTYLAESKGAFPLFDAAGFLSSGFAKTLEKDLQMEIKTHGMRNVTLLTIAPTGSTGTMVNTSTGIEPYFSWEWERKGRLGSFTEYAKPYEEWKAINPVNQPLPPYFVTSMELTPLEHVRMQAAAQKWIDTSISKTVNAPHNYTVAETSELYMAMYDLGCKGGTIYVDGSRSEQVLSIKTETKAQEDLIEALQDVFAEVNAEGFMSVSVGMLRTCPECKEHSLLLTEGCETCTSCGYGLCDV